ncbi:MAG: OmpA family protein [Desulfobacterales bacterium]|jgi:outer membrane protein OmpA-like peptidoglycan-associated protein
MQRIKTKKWRLTLAVFIWAVSILVLACSASRQVVRPAVNNPQDLVNDFERAVVNARTNQVDLLAPFWFSKAEDSLAEARKGLEEKAEISRIAEYVSIGQTQLKRAEEIAAVARTSMADVIKRREMARKAGAAELKGYPQAERRFFRLTKEIEDNNLDYVLRNKEKVKNSFRDLEIAAIKRNVLGEVRITLNEAERLGAKKYAPKAYADAVRNLNVAEAFITENPYEVEEMTRQAQEALFYARRAVELTRQSKKFQAMNSEQIALWIEGILSQTAEQLKAPDMRDQTFEIQRQNISGSIAAMQKNQDFLNTKIQEEEIEIETLKDRVFALEGKSRQEQIAREQLEAEKKFNEKFESIQNSFSSEEAEVYRQGNQLVIRLRGMQFPIGKAVILPENYALLSKVQLAIRTFNDPEVIVEGHTDITGSIEVNQQLSQERATAVKEYLVSNDTLPGSNVLAVGYGSARPLMSNETAEGRAVNRRIDVIITPRRP